MTLKVIVDDRVKNVGFNVLGSGDVFVFDGKPFLKVSPSDASAICLTDFVWVWVGSETMVTPANGVLTIEVGGE